MKVKVSEAVGPVLDWMVAKCGKRQIGFNFGGGLEVRGRTEDGEELPDAWDLWMPWHPSISWAQGGPIIERERINVDPSPDSPEWYGYYDNHGKWQGGPTPLIAAMRCYVASKLGDEVDVPEGLV